MAKKFISKTYVFRGFLNYSLSYRVYIMPLYSKIFCSILRIYFTKLHSIAQAIYFLLKLYFIVITCDSVY